jgi:hypothetical protein
MNQSPYMEPASADKAPTGLLLFRIYSAFQALLFLFLVFVGVFLIIAPGLWPTAFPVKPGEPPPALIGGVLSALYLVPFVVFVIGTIAPRRPWMYVYGIIACVMSMTCGGCWMLAIPTLIYWLKPETKQWLESRAG